MQQLLDIHAVYQELVHRLTIAHLMSRIAVMHLQWEMIWSWHS